MKLFECHNCGQLLYFENVTCEKCGHRLGFDPLKLMLITLKPSGTEWTSHRKAPGRGRDRYRFCRNAEESVCNWLLPAQGGEEYCAACRLNRTIPDLGPPENRGLWRKFESAKHRLVYGLLRLGLSVPSKGDDPEGGIAFDFLSPQAEPDGVITGHESGLITLNLDEADDAKRELNRKNLHEPYRTVLGHFRHEIGHYYWDQLVANGPWHERYRAAFGDESLDYQAALKQHYQNGPAPGWQENYISAYATSHPWEDFAETWAHYMHIVDTLETAEYFGMKIEPRAGRKGANRMAIDYTRMANSFDAMLEGWVPLTTALNTLNKSMGERDLYPFVLTQTITAKLRFVHELIADSTGR